VEASTRASDHPLIRCLLDEGHRFNFYQAISLLERAMPDAVPIGGTGPAADEALRFRPEPSLGFPAGAIERVEFSEGRFRIEANFMGLYGVDSPLPTHWAEDILHEYETDSTVRDFLDIFHHRIYSLLYRLWAKYRFAVQIRGDGADALTDRLLCLVGLGSKETREASGLPAVRLLRYAGLLIQHPRSALGLEVLVSDWFGGLSATVNPAIGRWVSLEADDKLRLGQRNNVLGRDAPIGERLYDVGGCFNLTLGSVGWEMYQGFLPDGAHHETLRRLINHYNTDPLAADLTLQPRGEEVPELVLDSNSPPRLGWTTWLRDDALGDVSAHFTLREHS